MVGSVPPGLYDNSSEEECWSMAWGESDEDEDGAFLLLDDDDDVLLLLLLLSL